MRHRLPLMAIRHKVTHLRSPRTHNSLLTTRAVQLNGKLGELVLDHLIRALHICHKTFFAEHSLYLEEVAVTPSPKRLDTLLKVLQAQGWRKLLPSDRMGLHPLLIPLASDANEPNQVTCLLRWPEPSKAKVCRCFWVLWG